VDYLHSADIQKIKYRLIRWAGPVFRSVSTSVSVISQK